MSIASKEIDIFVRVPVVELAVIAYNDPLSKNFNDLVRDTIITIARQVAPKKEAWPDVDTAALYLDRSDFVCTEEVSANAKKVRDYALAHSDIVKKLEDKALSSMAGLEIGVSMEPEAEAAGTSSGEKISPLVDKVMSWSGMPHWIRGVLNEDLDDTILVVERYSGEVYYMSPEFWKPESDYVRIDEYSFDNPHGLLNYCEEGSDSVVPSYSSVYAAIKKKVMEIYVIKRNTKRTSNVDSGRV